MNKHTTYRLLIIALCALCLFLAARLNREHRRAEMFRGWVREMNAEHERCYPGDI